jgi:hypothetical protein
VVVADQNYVSGAQGGLNVFTTENGFVSPKCLIELAQILTPVMRVLGADLALDFGERVQLRCAATGP